MTSIFKRRRQPSRRSPVPASGLELSAEDAGFSFEKLTEKTVNDCISAMMEAMPQKWNRTELRRWLLGANTLTLIARHDNTVTGVISGTVLNTPLPPPTIRLMIVLDPASGDKGLGMFLINAFIAQVQNRIPNASCIDVALPSSERTSIALYSLMGFDITGFIKDGFQTRFAGLSGQDLVLLRRRYDANSSLNIA